MELPRRASQRKVVASVIFRGKEKEIPVDHISTNLKTLGVTNAQFEKAIKELCRSDFQLTLA